MGNPFGLGFWALAAVLACVGAIAVYRGFFGDRARGRSRCPKCWYDMSGAVGLTCPECGKSARDEKALLRTHRRWWLVLLGLVLIVGGLIPVGGLEAVGRGWVKAAPDTLLILAASSVDDPEHLVTAELGRRTGVRFWPDSWPSWHIDSDTKHVSMWRWQRRLLSRRLAELLDRPDCSESMGQYSLEMLVALLPDSRVAMPTIRRIIGTRYSIHSVDALYLLSELGPEAQEALPELILNLEWLDGPNRISDLVVKILSDIGPGAEDAVDSLLAFDVLLTGRWNADDKLEVYEALGRIGPGAVEAIPVLLEVFDLDIPVARAIALHALCEIAPADERVVPLLVEAIVEEDFSTREAAGFGVRKQPELLAEVLADLIRLLESSDVHDRLIGLRGLVVLGEDSSPAIELVRHAMHDENRVVRALATTVCGQMKPGTEGVQEAIQEATQDADVFVAAVAQRAVRSTGTQ